MDKHIALASFSVEARPPNLVNNEEMVLKIRPKSTALHQKSTSNLNDPPIPNLNLNKGESSEKLNKLKIVRLSNSRSNCKSNLSSQKETSREKVKIQNLIKLQNLKDKLVLKPGVKIRLRNASLKSNGSKTQQSDGAQAE